MSVIRCCRCEVYIDTDIDVEVFTNEEIPELTKNDFDWVCFSCLTNEEAKRIEER